MRIKTNSSIIILYADDDPEDRMLARDAFEESRLANKLIFVEDGEELMNYLTHQGEFEDKEKFPVPGLILLDLNMPKKDGREVIKEMKSNPDLKYIPIIVLTTSSAEEDILKTYDLGVNSFITKPVTFDSLVEIMKTLGKYWFEVVELPQKENS